MQPQISKINCASFRRCDHHSFPAGYLLRRRLHQGIHRSRDGVFGLCFPSCLTENAPGDSVHRILMVLVQSRPVWWRNISHCYPGSHQRKLIGPSSPGSRGGG